MRIDDVHPGGDYRHRQGRRMHVLSTDRILDGRRCVTAVFADEPGSEPIKFPARELQEPWADVAEREAFALACHQVEDLCDDDASVIALDADCVELRCSRADAARLLDSPMPITHLVAETDGRFSVWLDRRNVGHAADALAGRATAGALEDLLR